MGPGNFIRRPMNIGLDRPEAGAGDFRFLGEFADQVESAGIGQGIEDVGEVEICWMVAFGHG